jgi:hypothetical protein
LDVDHALALAHLHKGGNWPEYTFPGIGSPDRLIIQCDDGMFAIGSGDDADGPFESRRFAEAVATQGEGRHALATS